RQDMLEGLRYLFGHPVLRNILIMLTLLNFISTNRESQLVVLAEGQLHASDFQFGLLNAAGGAGVVIFSLLAGPLRKRGGYIRLALAAIQIGAVSTIALAFSPTIWVAIPLWAVVLGTDNLFNIYSNTLRQEILPNELLGRARAIAAMMSFGALPLGALLSGAVTSATGNVVLVYAGVGVALLLVATLFSFPIQAHAKRLQLGDHAPGPPESPEAAGVRKKQGQAVYAKAQGTSKG